MISNCGHDENNKYSNGAAGDQTTTEWNIVPWYNKPWKAIFRHPNDDVRERIAQNAEKAASNDKVGYDQNQRTTYWTELSSVNFNAAAITNPCEADCSSGVAANVKAAGYICNDSKLKNVPQTMWTGNAMKILKNAGFNVLTDSKYLTSDSYLLRGDILFIHDDKLGKHHMATNLNDGASIKKTAEVKMKSNEEIANEVIDGKWGNDPDRSNKLKAAGYDSVAVQTIVNSKLNVNTGYTAEVHVNTCLNCRDNPNMNGKIITTFTNGTRLHITEESNGWGKCPQGWVSLNYIKKV